MEQLKNHIREIIPLEEEEFTFLESLVVRKKLRKHQFLVQEGEQVDYHYFVLKGCLRAYFVDVSGKEHIIQFAIENWWISDFYAFYKEKSAHLYIDCLENAELVAISRENMNHLYKTYPKFERFFRLKITGAFLTLRRRIISNFHLNAFERYLEFLEDYPNIGQRIPNHQIASYLGITPESLSRARRQYATR